MNASTLLLFPMMAQMLLTLMLVVWLGYARMKALKTGQVTLEEVRLKSDGWPEHVTKIANNFNNQFQLPVLFYMLCLLVIGRGSADGVLVSLAWSFVVFRVLHSFIHTGYNIVSHRFYAYLGSLISLFAMWCIVLWQLWQNL